MIHRRIPGFRRAGAAFRHQRPTRLLQVFHSQARHDAADVGGQARERRESAGVFSEIGQRDGVHRSQVVADGATVSDGDPRVPRSQLFDGRLDGSRVGHHPHHDPGEDPGAARPAVEPSKHGQDVLARGRPVGNHAGKVARGRSSGKALGRFSSTRDGQTVTDPGSPPVTPRTSHAGCSGRARPSVCSTGRADGRDVTRRGSEAGRERHDRHGKRTGTRRETDRGVPRLSSEQRCTCPGVRSTRRARR